MSTEKNIGGNNNNMTLLRVNNEYIARNILL